MSNESCGICGGDGNITNSFGGGNKRCPGCGGTGRRAENTSVFVDVTKTKASHHRRTDKAKEEKQTWPSTAGGQQLANEVKSSSACDDEVKARLIREIIEYEGSHGSCTKTFSRKVRKQIGTRPPSAAK